MLRRSSHRRSSHVLPGPKPQRTQRFAQGHRGPLAVGSLQYPVCRLRPSHRASRTHHFLVPRPTSSSSVTDSFLATHFHVPRPTSLVPYPPHVLSNCPNPSGYLHSGNLLAFLVQEDLAKRHGALLGLRIDDLDRERFRRVFERCVSGVWMRWV